MINSTIRYAVPIALSVIFNPDATLGQSLLAKSESWWQASDAALKEYARPHKRQESDRNYNDGMNQSLSKDKSFIPITMMNDYTPICRTEHDTHAYRLRANGRSENTRFACENLPLGAADILLDPKLARPYLDGEREGGNIDAAPNFVPAYAWIKDSRLKEGVKVVTVWVKISDVSKDAHYAEPMTREQVVKFAEMLSSITLMERRNNK